MEPELQRMPSQQSAQSKTSPVFLERPPGSSALSQIDHENTTKQEQPQSEAPRSKKASDSRPRRLSFMSFMSLMPGKSQRSPKTGNPFATQHGYATTEAPAARLITPPSPAASDRTSPGPPESEDRIGALPTFGISDRAYLASLVSLFSASAHGDHPDSNSSYSPLSSALTALTAPSIEEGCNCTTNLGTPYEYDVHSPAVYAYAKEKRLYIGLPGLVHPPPEALLEFELETLPLLERDLGELSGHLGQRGVRLTYELRMSGSASLLKAADTVTLAPTVWILYRSYSHAGLQSCQLELQRVASQLPYLQGRPFEVQEGGGRIELAGDRRLFDVEPVHIDDQIQLSGGGALSIHLQAGEDQAQTVCGALCSVTILEDDNRQTQSLCRLGGLLLVNGKYVLGVTTAHAMLDSSTIFKDSFDNPSEPRSLVGKAVDRDAITAEAAAAGHPDDPSWQDVTRDAAVDFLGVSMNSRGEMAINRSRPENATDFALLRLRQSLAALRNQYTPPNAEKSIAITSSASAKAASLDEGLVYILCGGDQHQVVEGQLVWGSACFVVRKRNFHLRRIQTTRLLNASAAGAWVVRGEVLYGVVIAVYEDEPFALMMTAERLFSSILSSAFYIRSVELWDGILPEAYHRAHEEEQQQQKATKSKLGAAFSSSSSLSSKGDRGIKVDVRPLSNGSSHGSFQSRRGSKQGGAGSFKDTARLNTVKEGVETESEAVVGTTAAKEDLIHEEMPMESPKSYGLPQIEPSSGLGIEEAITSADTDRSFVTASEGQPTTSAGMTTTTTTSIPHSPNGRGTWMGLPPGLHARTESQTSKITLMSGAVQTPAGEEQDPLDDFDIEDWHIQDWFPGDETMADDKDDTKTSTTNLHGRFDLKTGPPVRSDHARLQVAEVSSIMTAAAASRDGRGQQKEEQGLPVAAGGQGQQDHALDPVSMDGASSSTPPPGNRSSLDDCLGGNGGGASPPRVSLSDSTATAATPTTTTTNIRRFFLLKRRDSSHKQAATRGSLDSEAAPSVVTTASSSQTREGGRHQSKKSSSSSSFLGRFARENAAASEKKGS